MQKKSIKIAVYPQPYVVEEQRMQFCEYNTTHKHITTAELINFTSSCERKFSSDAGDDVVEPALSLVIQDQHFMVSSGDMMYWAFDNHMDCWLIQCASLAD